jgi:cytochrome oxidase Cu insertion factor (SCO1/SenC/PrrC family)
MRLVLALALLFASTVTSASAAFADVLKVGDRAAELDVAIDASGKSVKLSRFKGKWLLVTAGAGWCKPCAKELPTWDKVAGDYKDKVTFVSLTLDDEIDDGKKFQKKMALKNMVVVYMPAEKSTAAARYGSATMPSSFVIDPQGVVRHVHAGFAERDASGEAKKLKGILDKLVK